MSKTTQQQFHEFRKSLNPKQFSNIALLTREAKKIRESNPDLSKRIMLRVSNLQKNKVQGLATERQSKIQVTKMNDTAMKQSHDNNTPDINKPTSNPTTHPLNSVVIEGELSDEQKASSLWEKITQSIGLHSFKVFVLLPVIIFASYQLLWASPRYESRTQLIVQQPDGMATMDASMALLSGLGVNTANTDTQLVQSYIYSNDMLIYLDENLGFRSHFEEHGDLFSRVLTSYSQEDLQTYFAKRVKVEIDEKSQVISVYAQGFTEKYAQQLALAIADKAEWYINDIGHQLAEAQLEFIRGEHQIVEQRLQAAQTELLSFQQQYNLLNPEAEGMALSQIAYGIEGQIATKRAELKALKSIMSANAPQVVNLENQVAALLSQLELEKQRLTQQGSAKQVTNSELSVSEVLAKFADLKVELELALKAFTSSTISLEKSRIEAYRQLKYLVLVESATLPEDDTYPKATYNIALLLVVLLLLYGIGRIIYATIEELK